WQKYWKYESGTVTLSATDAKSRAAAAKTSTIVLPKVDTDGALIGDFEYSLPVTYLKPTLKLSSKSGTVYTNNSADQTVTTQVLMLASSGLYEPLDLSSFDSATTLFALAKGGPATAEVSATDAATGVIEVTTKATTSGTFSIKLDNWSEAIPLKYAVKAVAKDTLTVSAPTVTLNSSIADGTGADVDVLVCLNGEPVDLTDTSITVTPSKNFASGNFDYDLRTDGVAKFSYKSDGAPVAGKYSLTFVKGKAKAAITIVVNGKPLANAVKYKINTKLNVTTGQKMVITPTLVGVAGPITDAKIDNASSKFEASYNEARNQIIVGVKSGETVPVSKANTEVITVTAGGIECPVTVKFATVSSKIAVKIAKVTLPLAKLSAGTAEGETNVLATYKIGKKTFTIDPVSYQFMDGKTAASEDSENPGWYKINASGVRVHYDQTTGKIEVVSLSGAQKAGAVVVNLTFNGGVTVKAKVPVTLKK
ncbi:MAG: hypothetical protein IK111_08610, partial [Lachnospiraceae bacterium]|nr:hypothetical protein [Lachnospiraceae bacterium]